jgi:hypothetical protein
MMMLTDTVDAKELFTSLDETWKKLVDLLSSADSKLINKIPFEGSWTIAQVVCHVTKSNQGMARIMQMYGVIPERNVMQAQPKLKQIFLDFKVKYNSPESIIPEAKEYDKEEVLRDLKNTVEQLTEQREKQNLSQLLELDILGELTKLELLYFVLYHTQRHIHQLENILEALAVNE